MQSSVPVISGERRSSERVSARSTCSALFELGKPGVAGLVMVTMLCGALVAPGPRPPQGWGEQAGRPRRAPPATLSDLAGLAIATLSRHRHLPARGVRASRSDRATERVRPRIDAPLYHRLLCVAAGREPVAARS